MSKMTATATFTAAGALGMIGAPLAAAEAGAPDATTQSIGSPGKLIDGNVIQEWTVTDLKPSSDAIPHPVVGTLWEATAKDQAVAGSVTPIVSNFNARADNGQTYRVLFGAATPQGVNPATLAQGQQTSGKIYFDVTGPTPDSVVYNAGGRDLLVWEQAAPAAPQSSAPARSYPSTRYPAQSSAPAAAPEETPVVEPAEAAPAVPGTPGAVPAAVGPEVAPPAGSQGTPLPAGSTGTPLPEGAAVAPPAEGAPVPASTEGAPLPAGTSQGTPLPEGGDQVQPPATYLPTP